MRKREVIIREKHGKFSVGYWDGNTGNADNDFRCFGIKSTKEEAEKLLLEVLRRNPKIYK